MKLTKQIQVAGIKAQSSRLYNNAFILRRRIPYVDGFPAGDPEIVFKFRHPDIQKAAETDVRPQILGDHLVKFKCQALPFKDRLGGIRMLFSHNVQFPVSRAGRGDKPSIESMIKIFPVVGVERGLHKVAEVILGCVVGIIVSWLMSKVWLVRPKER